MKFVKVILEAWSPYPVKHNKRYYEDELYIEYFDEKGYLHRKDGPAWTSKVTGRIEWWIHGVRHRLDGPAIIDPRHDIETYWVNGKQFSKEEFDKHFGEG